MKGFNYMIAQTLIAVRAREKQKQRADADMLDHTKRAIAFAGGPAQLARHIRAAGKPISTQAISQWLKVPAERVLIVEKATNGKVSREEMRPDVFNNVSGAA
jgi:DNA-binding transcriptional regulator YdaS (Cro superfamily)